jgi:hypothetical protein
VEVFSNLSKTKMDRTDILGLIIMVGVILIVTTASYGYHNASAQLDTFTISGDASDSINRQVSDLNDLINARNAVQESFDQGVYEGLYTDEHVQLLLDKLDRDINWKKDKLTARS